MVMVVVMVAGDLRSIPDAINARGCRIEDQPGGTFTIAGVSPQQRLSGLMTQLKRTKKRLNNGNDRIPEEHQSSFTVQRDLLPLIMVGRIRRGDPRRFCRRCGSVAAGSVQQVVRALASASPLDLCGRGNAIGIMMMKLRLLLITGLVFL